MSSHAPSANSGPYKLLRMCTGKEVTTQIDFVLPNVRTEQVRCGPYWFTNRTTVTPISRDACRLDFVAAWNLFRWMPFVTPILKFFGRRFIAQDQRVIDLQQPGLKVQPRMMLIDDADRQARWYFQLKAAYLDSRQTGAPMIHPMDGPDHASLAVVKSPLGLMGRPPLGGHLPPFGSHLNGGASQTSHHFRVPEENSRSQQTKDSSHHRAIEKDDPKPDSRNTAGAANTHW